jgi:cytochrome c-type biogenesis protein CcmF
VIIAVGLAAATAFGHRTEVALSPGQSATFAGHRIQFVGTRTVKTPSRSAFQAVLKVDGGGSYLPAITQFGAGSQDVGTPAIDASWRDDVYLTIDATATSGSQLTFGVVVQPLVMWLWVGGALLVFGSVLSAVPGRRRRPTDPVSAVPDSVASATGPEPSAPVGAEADVEGEPGTLPDPDPEPVRVGN